MSNLNLTPDRTSITFYTKKAMCDVHQTLLHYTKPLTVKYYPHYYIIATWCQISHTLSMMVSGQIV
jgi:hypothetical protein